MGLPSTLLDVTKTALNFGKVQPNVLERLKSIWQFDANAGMQLYMIRQVMVTL